MSDAPTPDHVPAPSPSVPGPAQEVDVDLAAFLPEGVELGAATDDNAAAGTGVDPVDGIGGDPVAGGPTAVPADAGVEPERAPVDLEALSQIERDLDAVDAAIAALDAGTYGIDPTSGAPIDDELLAENPTRLS